MVQHIYYDFTDNSSSTTNHGTLGGSAVTGYGTYAEQGSFTAYNFYHVQNNSTCPRGDSAHNHTNGQSMAGEFGSSGGIVGGVYSGIQAICCPHSADNYTNVTFIFGFRYRGANADNYPAYLADKAMGGFTLKITTGGYLQIQRVNTAVQAVYWQSNNSLFSAGHDYYLEIRWACGTPSSPGTPHVHLYVDQSATKNEIAVTKVGTISGSWIDDSVGWWYLGNYGTNYSRSPVGACTGTNTGIGGSSGAHYQLRGSFYVARIWNEVLAEDTTYYDTDKTKWLDISDVSTPVSVTGATASTPPAVVGINVTTLTTTSGTASISAVVLSLNMAVNVLTATSAVLNATTVIGAAITLPNTWGTTSTPTPTVVYGRIASALVTSAETSTSAVSVNIIIVNYIVSVTNATATSLVPLIGIGRLAGVTSATGTAIAPQNYLSYQIPVSSANTVAGTLPATTEYAINTPVSVVEATGLTDVPTIEIISQIDLEAITSVASVEAPVLEMDLYNTESVAVATHYQNNVTVTGDPNVSYVYNFENLYEPALDGYLFEVTVLSELYLDMFMLDWEYQETPTATLDVLSAETVTLDDEGEEFDPSTITSEENVWTPVPVPEVITLNIEEAGECE